MTSSCHHCGHPLPILSPAQAVAYLERRGWIETDGAYPWASFELGEDLVHVPLGAWRDYPRRFLGLARDVACLEDRALHAILSDMATPPFEPTSEQIARVGAMLAHAPIDCPTGGMACDVCEPGHSDPAEVERLRAGLREALDGYEITAQALAAVSGSEVTEATRARIAALRELSGNPG